MKPVILACALALALPHYLAARTEIGLGFTGSRGVTVMEGGDRFWPNFPESTSEPGGARITYRNDYNYPLVFLQTESGRHHFRLEAFATNGYRNTAYAEDRDFALLPTSRQRVSGYDPSRWSFTDSVAVYEGEGRDQLYSRGRNAILARGLRARYEYESGAFPQWFFSTGLLYDLTKNEFGDSMNRSDLPDRPVYPVSVGTGILFKNEFWRVPVGLGRRFRPVEGVTITPIFEVQAGLNRVVDLHKHRLMRWQYLNGGDGYILTLKADYALTESYILRLSYAVDAYYSITIPGHARYSSLGGEGIAGPNPALNWAIMNAIKPGDWVNRKDRRLSFGIGYALFE